MKRLHTHRVALLGALVSIACGLPLYLALDHFHWLPLALRDRPWPLEAIAIAGAVVTVACAWRALRARRARVLAIGCAAFSLASSVCLVVVARHTLHQLPAPARGLELGAAVDFTLPDDTGRPVRLASLRGGPMLLYFYRGGW